jgi:hypothetical protein
MLTADGLVRRRTSRMPQLCEAQETLPRISRTGLRPDSVYAFRVKRYRHSISAVHVDRKSSPASILPSKFGVER